MKPILAALLSLVAVVGMTSCAQSVNLADHGHVSTFTVPHRASPDGTGQSRISPYVGLEHPAGTIGGTYHHNGRELAGGRYETGQFEYKGRPYFSRYHHNGQYYYGGYFREHEKPRKPAYQTVSADGHLR
ncbi:hypothetical protein [Brevifollis gellanilyticus]|nr:hypothetical protein [Brevifollis gellanilyticus]